MFYFNFMYNVLKVIVPHSDGIVTISLKEIIFQSKNFPQSIVLECG